MHVEQNDKTITEVCSWHISTEWNVPAKQIDETENAFYTKKVLMWNSEEQTKYATLHVAYNKINATITQFFARTNTRQQPRTMVAQRLFGSE